MELDLVGAAVVAASTVVAAVVVGATVLLVGRRTGDTGAARNHTRSLVALVLVVGGVLTVARALGSDAVSTGLAELGQTAVEALPGAVVAVLFLSIGLLVAGAVRSLTRQMLHRLQPGIADPASRIVHAVLVVLVVLTVLGQLGLRTGLLERVLLVVMGALAAAFALSLGLALRPLLGAVVAARHVHRVAALGDRIEIADVEGTVDRLGPSSVRLRLAGGDTVEIPNDWFLERPTRHREGADPPPVGS